MASPSVAYMGHAVRFGDIHQALGFRWTADGEETLFLRSKVLVDTRATGIRYPISGMWGGGRDDFDGLREWAVKLRNLGYFGMMLGDPSHITLVRRGVLADRRRARVLTRPSTGSRPQPRVSAPSPILYGGSEPG